MPRTQLAFAALIDGAVERTRRNLQPRRRAILPQQDLTYESERVLSQHRNGCHVIYKAMHALNLESRGAVTYEEIVLLLAAQPKCGGYAFFIKESTIRSYLHKNPYGLWRKLRTRRKTGRRGHPRALYVAAGLTVAGRRLA